MLNTFDVRITSIIFAILCQIAAAPSAFGEEVGSDIGRFDEVMFGSTLLRVPHILHAAVGSSKVKPSAAISMIVRAPDLAPRPYRSNDLGWTDQLTILIEYPQHFREPDAIISEILKDSNRDTNKFVEMNDGCDLYADLRPLLEDLIVCRMKKDHVFYARCYLNGNVPFPSCTVMENLSLGSNIIYTFGKNYIDDLPTIDQNINSLFASFYQSK